MFLSTEANYSTNYADDTTPYVIGNNWGEVVSELKTIKWALNNKINRLHERCLRILYNDKTSTFNELLEIYSIHYRNIQALAIVIFKVGNEMSPVIMNEIFQRREESHYNLRYTSNFVIPPIYSVHHGNESASYLGPKIWELISPAIRQVESFDGFKKEIEKWKPTNCPCRICKS